MTAWPFHLFLLLICPLPHFFTLFHFVSAICPCPEDIWGLGVLSPMTHLFSPINANFIPLSNFIYSREAWHYCHSPSSIALSSLPTITSIDQTLSTLVNLSHCLLSLIKWQGEFIPKGKPHKDFPIRLGTNSKQFFSFSPSNFIRGFLTPKLSSKMGKVFQSICSISLLKQTTNESTSCLDVFQIYKVFILVNILYTEYVMQHVHWQFSYNPHLKFCKHQRRERKEWIRKKNQIKRDADKDCKRTYQSFIPEVLRQLHKKYPLSAYKWWLSIWLLKQRENLTWTFFFGTAISWAFASAYVAMSLTAALTLSTVNLPLIYLWLALARLVKKQRITSNFTGKSYANGFVIQHVPWLVSFHSNALNIQFYPWIF